MFLHPWRKRRCQLYKSHDQCWIIKNFKLACREQIIIKCQQTKFMVFHNYQRTLAENDIPQLMINNTIIETVNEFNFLGLTINEFLNWRSHSAKIANKISRTLGVMNRLKRYLPFSAMKLMYDSLVLSHLQFGISCWGFECDKWIMNGTQDFVSELMVYKHTSS